MEATHGLVNALLKNKNHMVCTCGFPIPKYPGLYPKRCPNCDRPLKQEANPEAV